MCVPVCVRVCVCGVCVCVRACPRAQLLRRGCIVHGIVRYRTHWGNLGGMLDGSVTLHKGDITDAAFVRDKHTCMHA